MLAADVERARRDTPGCESVIHLNNAGAALPPSEVLDAVIGHLRREAEIGGYEAAAEVADRIERTYAALAELLNCSPDEIAVVENATRAWDMACYGLRLRPGDVILTTVPEYASNYIALLQRARHTGARVEVLPDDEHGQVDLEALARRLDADPSDGPGSGRVALVSLVHVPTQGGLVQPAEQVGALCRAAGVPLLLDACQSVGQLDLDVRRIGCDMLSGTGRKFLRGPRGTGFLYVRRELIERLEPPFLDLHAAEWVGPEEYRIRADARRFENWESAAATKIGLGVAVDYALRLGLEVIEARAQPLAAGLRERLAGLAGVTVHDRGVRRGAIVSFTVDGVSATDIADRLRAPVSPALPVNVTVAALEENRLDLGARGLNALVRASPHYYNNEAELDTLADRVAAIGHTAATAR